MTMMGRRALTPLRVLRRAASRRTDALRITAPTLLVVMLALFVAALFANVGMGAVEIPPAQALDPAQPRRN